MSKSLDEIEALLAKATAGEWELRGPTAIYGNLQRDQNNTADLVARTVTDNDAAAIVAAVNWCRSEGIAAARERDRLREALEWALAEIDGNTDYRSGRQQIAAYNRARTALEASHDAR